MGWVWATETVLEKFNKTNNLQIKWRRERDCGRTFSVAQVIDLFVNYFNFDSQLMQTRLRRNQQIFSILAYKINGPPIVVLLAVDHHEHLVEVPLVTDRCWTVPRSRSTRHLRISAANIRPNRFHQRRTVSWLMSTPHLCGRSSTLRSDRGYLTYIITARRMTSGDVLKYRNGLCLPIPQG